LLGKIEAVLFDLDETLIDAQSGLAGAHQRVAQLVFQYLTKQGFHIDSGALTSKIKVLDDRLNRERNYDRNVWWPRLMTEIAPHLILPNDLIYKLTIEYWNAYSECSPPYPDAAYTLTTLKERGYRLGLVSDTDGIPGLKSKRIRRLPFRELFSVTIVAGEDTPELKPSPAPFLKALNIIGVSNKATVFVGDKPFTDIAGAKEAGMMAIRVWRRKWNSNIEADLTIESLKELLTVL
jgi:putative hydrolase of the HAD superfamily